MDNKNRFFQFTHIDIGGVISKKKTGSILPGVNENLPAPLQPLLRVSYTLFAAILYRLNQ